ncbi:hypothetical protein [Streptomyces sp. NPDC059564]|uniref:hypothetical protein n=1 Tax=Streptomyces sp. NPDC059564 TaxID=3346865 RepID=UPI003694D677
MKLAADVRLGDAVTATGVAAGTLSLAAGTEGTVEQVVEHQRQETHEVREYARLSSLLDDFGHAMPPQSRTQLEERVGALEPAWTAFHAQAFPVTVRVRLDNGFVLDDAQVDAFTPA